MLLRVAEKVRQGLEHATKHAQSAQSTLDPERKADFLDIEQRWLRLAESYRLVEQLERFVLDGKRYRREHNYADQPYAW